jgi:hypothetical protein
MNKFPALRIYNRYRTVAKVMAADVIGLLFIALPSSPYLAIYNCTSSTLLIHYVYCKIQTKNLH